MKKEFQSGVSVVIPCLNEAETIAQAVNEALGALRALAVPGEVIVADNGSTDGSQRIAEKEGARVIPLSVRGYGAALHGGILASRYEWVVFGDADLSYPFHELSRLIEPLSQGRAELVLGSRLRGSIAAGAMPFLNRHLGTPVLSFLIRLLYRLPISDCNSGMRALLRSQYERLSLRCPGMEYASEMLVRAALRGFRYAEVPINFRKDARSRAPHLRRWRDGWRHLRFILGNGPATSVIGVPLLASLLLLGTAFFFSIQQIFTPESPVHYHSAFIASAMSVPFLLFTVSMLLVKAALHESDQVQSEFVRILSHWGERSYPIITSLCFFGLAMIESVILAYRWSKTGWGELDEVSSTIRIVVFTLLGGALFSLDMGLGILKLIPYASLEVEIELEREVHSGKKVA